MTDQSLPFQVFFCQLHSLYAALVIGFIILDSSLSIYTAGISRHITGSFLCKNRPLHHTYLIQYMKYLGYIGIFLFLTSGIPKQKGSPYETGGRRSISRKSYSSHSLTVGFQGQLP